jgi:hypothetical protein
MQSSKPAEVRLDDELGPLPPGNEPWCFAYTSADMKAYALAEVRRAVAAERNRWTNAVSNAERDRNDATQVRDAALAALFEVERLAGHDDALTEWREKWAHLWALRDGPNSNLPAPSAG